MRKTVFAGLVAAMTLAVASVAQAAPAAPVPAGVSADHGAVTQVQYWRYHHGWGYRGYGRHHRHWHCWWRYHRRVCGWTWW